MTPLALTDERYLMSKKKAGKTKKLTATNEELRKTLAVARGQLTKSRTIRA